MFCNVVCKGNFNFYRVLVKVQETLKLMLSFKLTDTHVNPDNFQKMFVRLAAQLFSLHVTMAFLIYRKMAVNSEAERNIQVFFEGTTTTDQKYLENFHILLSLNRFG